MDIHTAAIIANQYWIIAGIFFVAIALTALLVYLVKAKKDKYDVNPKAQPKNDSITTPQ